MMNYYLRSRIIIIFVVLFAATLSNGQIVNIGIRGCMWEAPENTVSAILTGFEAGAEWVELDVRLTKDNRVVVFHDETLERTSNGTGRVRDYTLEQLKQFDVGTFFDPSFAGERIPTLEEALRAAAGRGKVLLDIKEMYSNMSDEIVLALDAVGMSTNNIIVNVKTDISLAHAKAELPGVPIFWKWWTSENWDGPLPSVPEPGYFEPWLARDVDGIITSYYHDLTQEFVAGAHDVGLEVIAWGYNQPSQLDIGVTLGLEGIITAGIADLSSRIEPQDKPTPGDANLDGLVILDDLDRLGLNFGRDDDVGWLDGDFNFDGMVDLMDLDLLGLNYQRTAPSPLPEPGVFTLLLLALPTIVTRRR